MYTSTGNLSRCFFTRRKLISVCSYSFWRRSNYFLSSGTVAVFDPGGINIFLKYSFSRCVRSVQRQQTRKLLDLDTGRWRQERTIHKYPYHDRLYLHFILWSGARKLCFKGVRVVNTLAGTHKIGHVACVVGWCFRGS